MVILCQQADWDFWISILNPLLTFFLSNRVQLPCTAIPPKILGTVLQCRQWERSFRKCMEAPSSCISLYTAVLTIITYKTCIDDFFGKIWNLTFRFKIDHRLEELQVLDIKFLYGCAKPTIVVLYQVSHIIHSRLP